ncbi:hypothetical protein ACH82I_17610 [Brevibacterium sp. GP-SGM9]|uniref:hypothetical protein n=1 Tax=Brevibacterium sp. GP-SGM9 TaxID=3376990 RepID=UPI0039A54350
MNVEGRTIEEDAVSAPPPDLSEWALHAFCLGARSSPHPVVAMDDNGRILYYAVGGIDMDRLMELGLKPNESQLALMKAYRLLTVEDGRLTTSFPVVGPQVMGELRRDIRAISADVTQSIRRDSEEMCAELARRGHAHHGYAVVFGHAVDGLVWEQLRDQLPSTKLSLERPFWNGAFWAIHPRRDDAAGVNEHPWSEGTLVSVWSARIAFELRSFLTESAVGRLTHNADGVLPVIHSDDSDELHRHGKLIAERLAEAILCDPRSKALSERIVGTHPGESLLIFAHELIWDLMDCLVEATPLVRPRALDNGSAPASDLRQLLFIRQ